MQWKSLRFERLILAKWQVWGRLGSNVICSKDNSATAIHHTGKCACVVCTEYTIKEVGEPAYTPWPISAESIVTESNFLLCFDLQMPCRYMYAKFQFLYSLVPFISFAPPIFDHSHAGADPCGISEKGELLNNIH